MISSGGKVVAVFMAVFTFLVTISMGLRFYTLLSVKKRKLRTDDYLISVSYLALLAIEGAMAWAVHHGLGAHTATLPWDDIAVQIKMTTSNLWSWTIATSTCKLALLFMYLELFHTHTGFRRTCWVLIALTSCYPMVFIPYFMTQCSPVSAAWDPVLSQTNCRPLVQQELASVAVNLALDAAIVICPLPVIWDLKMPTNKKVGVSLMFSLGLAVIAIMIWRLVSTASSAHGSDMIYELTTTALQGQLEVWLGILAANLPTLGPLMMKIPCYSAGQYVSSYWKSGGTGGTSSTGGRSSHHHHKKGLPVSLDTFGSSTKSKVAGRDDFHLLEDGTGVEGGAGPDELDAFSRGIMRSRDFNVTVESTHSAHKYEPDNHHHISSV